MRKSTNTLESIAAWFRISKPKPTSNDITTQIGVHFEEVSEMLDALHSNKMKTALLIRCSKWLLSKLANHLKNNKKACVGYNKLELLDSLGDQIVTATGVGVFCDMKIVDALKEINESNYSKFVGNKPVFLPNGKVGKGPNYCRPNLRPFI